MVEIIGSFVNGSIAAVKKRNGDQVYNNIISQLDEQTRRLFENPISDTVWYSLDSYTKYLELDIKLTANGDENELVNRAMALDDKYIRDFYGSFIKSESHWFFIKHMIIFHQAILRGVSIKIKLNGPDKAIIAYNGFEKQHRLIGLTIIGFYTKVLEISGAKEVHLKYLTSIEDDKSYCELEITWKGK